MSKPKRVTLEELAAWESLAGLSADLSLTESERRDRLVASIMQYQKQRG